MNASLLGHQGGSLPVLPRHLRTAIVYSKQDDFSASRLVLNFFSKLNQMENYIGKKTSMF